VLSGETEVGSLLWRLVGSGDRVLFFEDFVYGAAAHLDAFLLVEICGDRFTAPPFTLSDLNDSSHGFFW